MAKRIQEYVKYTRKELDSYTKMNGTCVVKVNTSLHLNLAPHALGDIKTSILNFIATKKIGFFEPKLCGIILEIKDIKLLDHLSAIRFDDSKLHLNIVANCYVFQPHVGSVVRGTVRHVSYGQVGVILFRVFSVAIRVTENSHDVKINEEVLLKIKNFNFRNVFPYIEGELLSQNFKKEKNCDESIENDEEKPVGESELSKLLKEIKRESQEME